MLLGQHCSMLSTILFGIVTPDCGLIQAQQYCSILLTTRNNVAPTTLLHPVFNNLLQLIIFCRVYLVHLYDKSTSCKTDYIVFSDNNCQNRFLSSNLIFLKFNQSALTIAEPCVSQFDVYAFNLKCRYFVNNNRL